jgi:hypothetical protein
MEFEANHVFLLSHDDVDDDDTNSNNNNWKILDTVMIYIVVSPCVQCPQFKYRRRYCLFLSE